RCEEGGRWEDVKVALPVVLGLHGSLGTPRLSLCPASIIRWPWIPKTLQPGTARGTRLALGRSVGQRWRQSHSDSQPQSFQISPDQPRCSLPPRTAWRVRFVPISISTWYATSRAILI